MEGGNSDRLFMVREGQVGFYKRLPRQNFAEKNCFQELKVLDLGPGDVFGDDNLFFKCPNRFTVKITSLKAEIIAIKSTDFQRRFKNILGHLHKNLKARNSMVEHQLQLARNNNKQKSLTHFQYQIQRNLPEYKEIQWGKQPIKPEGSECGQKIPREGIQLFSDSFHPSHC